MAVGLDGPVDAGGVAILPPHSCRRLVRVYAAAARRALDQGRHLSPEEADLLRVLRAVAERSVAEMGSAETVDAEIEAPSLHDHVDTATAAQMLNVTPRRVRQLLDAEIVSGMRPRPGTAWRVDVDSLHAYLNDKAR